MTRDAQIAACLTDDALERAQTQPVAWWAALKGNCRGCGKPGMDTEATARENLASVIALVGYIPNGEDFSKPPGINVVRSLAALEWFCSGCGLRSETLIKEREWSRRIETLLADAVNRELVTREQLGITFSTADRGMIGPNWNLWEYCRAWREDSGPSLWIHGIEGRGKSHLMTCMITDALARGIPGAVLSIRVVNELTRDWEAPGTIKPFRETAVLGIDDFDKVRTEAGIEILWGLLDYRNANRLKTICTANLTAEGAAKLLASKVKNPTTTQTLFARLSRPGLRCKEIELIQPYSLRKREAQDEAF